MIYGILWGKPLIFMKFFRCNLILFRGRPIFFGGKPIFYGSLNFTIKSEWFRFIVLQIEKKMEAFAFPKCCQFLGCTMYMGLHVSWVHICTLYKLKYWHFVHIILGCVY